MERTPKAQLFTIANNLARQESARRRITRIPMLERSLLGTKDTSNDEKRKSVESIREHVDKVMEAKHRVLQQMQDRMDKSLDDDEKPGSDSRLDEDVRDICDELGIHVDANESWFVKLWFTWFRLRQAFFLMCAFAILLSLFTGALMEIFYSIMGGNFKKYDFWSILMHVLFWALPFYMINLALLGDEMCDLILDSLDSPPLHGFQAMLITALHWKKRPYVKVKAVKTADIITFVLFEVVPFAVGVGTALSLFLQKGHDTDIWGWLFHFGTLYVEGYVQGSLLSAILCTMIFVVTDMLVAYRSMGDLQSAQGMRLKWFSGKIDQQKLNPYCLRWYFARWATMHSGASSADGPATPSGGRRPSLGEVVVENEESLCRALQVVFPCVAIWTVAVIFCSGFNKKQDYPDVALLGTALVVAVVGCSWGLHKVCPRIYGMPFIAILSFFVLVNVAFTVGSAYRVPSADLMQPIMTVKPGNVTNAKQRALRWPWSEVAGKGYTSYAQPYPVCDMTWGSPDAPLRALDLANLAWLVYDPTKDGGTSIRKNLKKSFPEERRAQLVTVRPYDDLPRWGHFYFPAKGNATGGTRVVAVKGTSTPKDALADTNLFSTVQVLQFFNTVLPVLTILPRLAIQWLVHNVHFGVSRTLEKDIWKRLEGNISNLVAEYPNDTFVITGHSLGGALSQIAAANLSLPALVWSSPGMEYSATRFGIEVQALKRSVVSVMPDHDMVPRVDLQGGTLQLIECRAKNGDESSALHCHSLVKTACEIWRVCGDDRDFHHQCADYVSEDDLGKLYKDDDSIS